MPRVEYDADFLPYRIIVIDYGTVCPVLSDLAFFVRKLHIII